jgi:predicted ATPase/DNA-binding CsgD family transcriptional regulator
MILQVHNNRHIISVMPNNIPVALTSLIGREQEIDALCQLLRRPDVRLVTITGLGGVGKTSLAQQVAHELHDTFHKGVFFISLASISDPVLIIPTIAHVLGVTESPNRLLLDSLKDFLLNKQILLLLDNFEQIISAAPLLTEILESCPELRMFVTSREALRLRGEREFPLSPFTLPDQPSLEILIQSPSVALFVQRAQASQPDFMLTSENTSAVTEICARLDGLPLAIELAAARIKLLPPQAMLRQLQESPLQMLTGGSRDLPARQQTLRSTVQWSYDLLNSNEQRLFRWFSVFVGGCTLEAAIQVMGQQTSLDILDSLVNKNLSEQHETDHSPRLSMLETIREFGLEQLNHTHELESARRAHATYYLAFAEDAERELTGADQKSWLQRLEREQDNMRAALHWAIEHSEVEFTQRMAGALQPFWFRRGHWSEGRRWLEESLAIDPGAVQNQLIRAKALFAAGMLARFQGDFARARILCEQSLTACRDLGDKTGILKALAQLSRISSFQDDQTATNVFVAEAASLIESLPDSIVKADAYTDIAIAMISHPVRQGLYPSKALQFMHESERIQRVLNNPAGLALALIHQASHALFAGEYALATSQLDESERVIMELGDDRLLSRMAMIRMFLDLHKGDFTTARRRVEEILQEVFNRGDHHVASSLPIMSVILHGQGLDVWSARVFGLAEALTRAGQWNSEVAVVDQRLHTGDIRDEVRARLGEETFDREMAAGRRLKLEDLLTIPHPQGLTPDLSPLVIASDPGAALTAREIEVLHLLAQDLSNPQIAEKLVVSRRTVDAHLRSIYDKLDVKSRDAAIRVSRERGLISSL